MADLETATTQEIAEELDRRFDGLLLVTFQRQTKTSTVTGRTEVSFSGGCPMAIGLAEWAKADLTSRYVNTETRE